MTGRGWTGGQCGTGRCGSSRAPPVLAGLVLPRAHLCLPPRGGAGPRRSRTMLTHNAHARCSHAAHTRRSHTPLTLAVTTAGTYPPFRVATLLSQTPLWRPDTSLQPTALSAARSPPPIPGLSAPPVPSRRCAMLAQRLGGPGVPRRVPSIVSYALTAVLPSPGTSRLEPGSHRVGPFPRHRQGPCPEPAVDRSAPPSPPPSRRLRVQRPGRTCFPPPPAPLTPPAPISHLPPLASPA